MEQNAFDCFGKGAGFCAEMGGDDRWEMMVFVMGINGLRDAKRRVVVEEKWKRWGEKVLAIKENTCCDGEERLKEG